MRKPKFILSIALLLALFCLIPWSKAYAQIAKDSVTVKGIVLNERQKPVRDALVIVMPNWIADTFTNREGCFDLKVPAFEDSLILFVEAFDYNQKLIAIKPSTGLLKIHMTPQKGGVICTEEITYKVPLIDWFSPQNNRIFTSEEMRTSGH